MAFSQSSKKADRYFKSKGYGKYVQIMGNDYGNMERSNLKKLATAHRKLANYTEIERIYATLIDLGDRDPLNHLYYAQALQANGRYLKSREHYRICDEMLQEKADGKAYDQRARLGFEACNRLADMRALGEVVIENEIVLNSRGYDFSPIFYNTGVVFVSNRKRNGSKNDHWFNDQYTDLYFSELTKQSELGKPELFASELITDLHLGPLVFDKNFTTMFLTKNETNRDKRKKEDKATSHLKIYKSSLENDKWTQPEQLSICYNDADYCHPALSSDQQFLVFASDRDGGMGGMDLWVSRFEKNEWQEPINLGPRINTKGNELFPYLHSDGVLFYSSNGMSSIGGLDIYMATQIMNHPDSLWEYPYNLGSPINSTSDDFGITMNTEKSAGFFSSNRKGSYGRDDIFRFNVLSSLDDVRPSPVLPIDVCVYDDQDRRRLPGVNLTVKRVSKLNEAPQKLVTNRYGYVSCEMRAGDQYHVILDKEGYLEFGETFNMPNTMEGLDEYCIGLNPDPNSPLFEAIQQAKRDSLATTPIATINYSYEPEELKEGPRVIGRVYNADNKNLPVARATIRLLNRCTGEELVMQVGNDGLFGFPLDCDCDYVVKSYKNNFTGDNQVISFKNSENCDDPISLDLSMSPDFEMGGVRDITNGILADDVNLIKEGDVFELKNILYDYDKWDIRKDAARDLEALVAILRKYPSMRIELSSHTDSRGSSSYNLNLSEKRAQSAKAYLLRRGIDSDRIRALGLGETKLKNNCSFCTESDHQENRRTEVKILTFIK